MGESVWKWVYMWEYPTSRCHNVIFNVLCECVRACVYVTVCVCLRLLTEHESINFFFIYFFVFKLIIIDILNMCVRAFVCDELFVKIELRMGDWLPNQVTINVRKWCVIYYLKINSRIQTNSFNFMIVFSLSLSLFDFPNVTDLIRMNSNKIENGNRRLKTIRRVEFTQSYFGL